MSTAYLTILLENLTNDINSFRNFKFSLDELITDLPHIEGDFNTAELATLAIDAQKAISSTIEKYDALKNEIKRCAKNG